MPPRDAAKHDFDYASLCPGGWHVFNNIMSKRNEYLSKRDLHREYLKSPAWKAFRMRALKHYGAICTRCGEHGTDIDHKTYKNWGNEKLEDVQVLCRPCHIAKHDIERAASNPKKRGRRSLHKNGVWAYMTRAQKQKIMDEFGYDTEFGLRYDFFSATSMTPLVKRACDIMNVQIFGLKPKSKKGWAGEAKAKKQRKRRERKLTPAEEERLIRAASKSRTESQQKKP